MLYVMAILCYSPIVQTVCAISV